MAGGVLVLITFAVPFDILWDVISLGVILSFNLTNTSLIMLRCGNGGKKVSNKVVRHLATLLWLTGAPGAYLTWGGYCDPKLNGGEVDWRVSGPGMFLILFSVVVVWQIDVHRKVRVTKCLMS